MKATSLCNLGGLKKEGGASFQNYNLILNLSLAHGALQSIARNCHNCDWFRRLEIVKQSI